MAMEGLKPNILFDINKLYDIASYSENRDLTFYKYSDGPADLNIGVGLQIEGLEDIIDEICVIVSKAVDKLFRLEEMPVKPASGVERGLISGRVQEIHNIMQKIPQRINDVLDRVGVETHSKQIRVHVNKDIEFLRVVSSHNSEILRSRLATALPTRSADKGRMFDVTTPTSEFDTPLVIKTTGAHARKSLGGAAGLSVLNEDNVDLAATPCSVSGDDEAGDHIGIRDSLENESLDFNTNNIDGFGAHFDGDGRGLAAPLGTSTPDTSREANVIASDQAGFNERIIDFHDIVINEAGRRLNVHATSATDPKILLSLVNTAFNLGMKFEDEELQDILDGLLHDLLQAPTQSRTVVAGTAAKRQAVRFNLPAGHMSGEREVLRRHTPPSGVLTRMGMSQTLTTPGMTQTITNIRRHINDIDDSVEVSDSHINELRETQAAASIAPGQVIGARRPCPINNQTRLFPGATLNTRQPTVGVAGDNRDMGVGLAGRPGSLAADANRQLPTLGPIPGTNQDKNQLVREAGGGVGVLGMPGMVSRVPAHPNVSTWDRGQSSQAAFMHADRYQDTNQNTSHMHDASVLSQGFPRTMNTVLPGPLDHIGRDAGFSNSRNLQEKRTKYPLFETFKERLRPELEDTTAEKLREYNIPDQPQSVDADDIISSELGHTDRVIDRYEDVLAAEATMCENARTMRKHCFQLKEIRDKNGVEQTEVYKRIPEIERKCEKALATMNDFRRNLGTIKRSLPQRELTLFQQFYDDNYVLYRTTKDLIDDALSYFVKHSVNDRSVSQYDQTMMDYLYFSGGTGLTDRSVYEFLENCIVNANRIKVGESSKLNHLKKRLSGNALKVVESYVQTFSQACEVLLSNFGDPFDNIRIIQDNHKALAGCPSYANAGSNPEEWKKIGDCCGKHLMLIRRAQHVAHYRPEIEKDLVHPNYVLLLAKCLPAEDYVRFFGEVDKNPQGMYTIIVNTFQSLFEKGQSLGKSVPDKKIQDRRQPRDKERKDYYQDSRYRERRGNTSAANNAAVKVINDVLDRTTLAVQTVADDPNCVICAPAAQEGLGVNLHRNHVGSEGRHGLRFFPSNCSFYNEQLKSAEERLTYLKKHKICVFCLHPLGAGHDDELCKRIQQGRSHCRACMADKQVYVRVELCAKHKHDSRNTDKLNAKRKFLAGHNIEFCMTATDRQGRVARPTISRMSDMTKQLMVEDISDLAMVDTIIRRIDNDAAPMLIHGKILGRTRALNVIYDSGSTVNIMRNNIIGSELLSYKYKKAKSKIFGVGGIKIPVQKYLVVLPLRDGTSVAVDTFGMDRILKELSYKELGRIYDDLKTKLSGKDRMIANKCQVYEQFEGQVDILLGVRMLQYFPDRVLSHEGLTLYRSNLQPYDSTCEYSLGGPVSTFECLGEEDDDALAQELCCMIREGSESGLLQKEEEQCSLGEKQGGSERPDGEDIDI